MTLSHPRRSYGTVLVCVLVCLTIASAMAAVALQATLRARRETRLEHQMRQTELLLEAGIARASRQIEVDASYQGERWQPSLFSDNVLAASVTIRVDRGKDGAKEQEAVEVEVIARISPEPSRSKQIVPGTEDTQKARADRNLRGTTQRSYRFNFAKLTAQKLE
jgi:type II secretory pathway pseudopilin PulG